MNRILPADGLMDTVTFPMRVAPLRRSFFKSLVCPHDNRVPYVRIDHRAGPGSFADNFEGEACFSCSKILKERQTL